MAENKYQLIKDDAIDFIHPTKAGQRIIRLYRIVALKAFRNPHYGDIKEGDVGGYVQSEKNLSHDGNCWVAHSSKVFDDAQVIDDALVQDDAAVYDKAVIMSDSVIKNLAHVRGAAVLDSCVVADKADVLGSPEMFKVMMYNSSRVYDNAKVLNTTMYDGAMIHGNAKVYKSVMKDVSEVRGNAEMHQVKMTGRAIIEKDEHVNASFHTDIDIRMMSGEGEYRG